MEDYSCTCENVAKILNSKVSTVRNYCKKGIIPAIKIGRSYRISQRDLEKWMNSKREYESAHEDIKVSEQYRILFENASDAIMICDPTGYLVLVNPRFCELLGYSQEEATNMHFSRFIHPDDLTKAVESLMKTMAGDANAKNLQVKLLTKDKETLFASITASTLYQQGDIKGIQATVRDFTEEKKADNKILFFSSMLDQTADAFVGIDGNRKIVYVNPATLRMFGYTDKEMIGQDIGLLHESKRVEKEKADITATVAKEHVWTGETLNKRKNGERFWCWINVNKVDDREGQLVAYAAIIKELDKKVDAQAK